MIRILKPGLQTSLQGKPRLGYRHFGIPQSGPADALSMALANRLVGNDLNATSLEITYGGFEALIDMPCTVAVTGAFETILVSGRPVSGHVTLQLNSGDILTIAPPIHGARAYLSVHSGFNARSDFGSTSTYLPAELGGYDGRTLKAQDVLSSNGNPCIQIERETPTHVKPKFMRGFVLRACLSAETHLLSGAAQDALFSDGFIAGRQLTRMGVELAGKTLDVESDGMMQSAPVFPGTIQCPPSGKPVLLLCDAQTTGGYPRIANIARCDRHLLGQIRPSAPVRLLKRTYEQAQQDYLDKQALLLSWLED